MTNFEKWKAELTPDFFNGEDGSPWLYFACNRCPALSFCQSHPSKGGDQCRQKFNIWATLEDHKKNNPECSENFERWAKKEGEQERLEKSDLQLSLF